MKATTQGFISLKNAYKQKFQEDRLLFENILFEIAKEKNQIKQE